MTRNRVKLERAVTFMKYLISVVSSIFLPETLILNKTTFPASNSLNLAKLDVTAIIRRVSQKNLLTFLFLSDLSPFNVKISRVFNSRTR